MQRVSNYIMIFFINELIFIYSIFIYICMPGYAPVYCTCITTTLHIFSLGLGFNNSAN